MPDEPGYSLLYDGECRICSAFARVVALLDVRGSLRVRRIQESEALLADIPADRMLASAHAVSPNGRVSSGAEAMPALVAALVADPAFESHLRSSHVATTALGAFYEIMRTIRGPIACAATPSGERSPR